MTRQTTIVVIGALRVKAQIRCTFMILRFSRSIKIGTTTTPTAKTYKIKWKVSSRVTHTWLVLDSILSSTLQIGHRNADYISFPLGSLGPLWDLWKWNSAHVYARGRKQCCKLHYCLWNVSIKPRLPFSNVMYSSFPKEFFFYVYFTTLQLMLVACGGRRTFRPAPPPPPPYTIVQIIFNFLWDHWEIARMIDSSDTSIGRFLMFYMDNNICDSLFAFLHKFLLLKGSTLKEKNLFLLQ